MPERKHTASHASLLKAEQRFCVNPVVGDGQGSLEQSRGPIRLATTGGFPVWRRLHEDGSSDFFEPDKEITTQSNSDASIRQPEAAVDVEEDERTLLRLGGNGF